MSSQPNSQSQSPVAAIFAEYNNCPQHRGLLLSLSSIIQSIVVQCPMALVWHNLGMF